MSTRLDCRFAVRPVIVATFISVFSVGVALPAAAHSWSHYRKIWSTSNDRYGGYAWLDADERVDFMHVSFRVKSSISDDPIRQEGLYCGPASESCGYRRTTSTYWQRRTRWIEHVHCGYDRTPAGYVHKFLGRANDTTPRALYGPCNSNSLYGHLHDYYYP